MFYKHKESYHNEETPHGLLRRGFQIKSGNDRLSQIELSSI
jgi:hypothetical protein